MSDPKIDINEVIVNTSTNQNTSEKIMSESISSNYPSPNVASSSTTNSTTNNNDNFKIRELLEEKKRKLTLPLPNSVDSNLGPSTSSNPNSNTSNDSNLNLSQNALNDNNGMNNGNSNGNRSHEQKPSTLNNLTFALPNKKLKTLYTPQGLVSLSNYSSENNKDSIANLDLGPNIPTPQINKLLSDYLVDNGNNLLKTPGSALAILTPNTSNSLFSCLNSNNINNNSSISGSGLTPNGSMSASGLTLTTPAGEYSNLSNYILSSNSTANSNFASYENQSSSGHGQNAYILNPALSYETNMNATALTPCTTIVNPNCIFGIINPNSSATNQISNHHQQGNIIGGQGISILSQPTHDSSMKYATLTTVSENAKFNTANLSNLSGSYVTLEPLNKKMKDELQTVPEHPVQEFLANTTNKQQQANKNKRTVKNKIRSINTNDSPLTSSNFQEQQQQQTTDILGIKKEPKAPSLIYSNSRRDTENSMMSTVSSICSNDSSNSSRSFTYSSQMNGCDNDALDGLKIEKKRERNRLAAQKCRTRKLEKIETLEKQVKTLTEANESQRIKSRQLLEEINQLKQKFEMHQKLHNCDLKLQ